MHSDPMIDRRRCAATSLRAAGALLAVLASVALLAACGGSSKGKSARNLDTAKVAHSIEQSILQQRHLKYTVTCPARVRQEAGRTFECLARGHTAKEPRKTVTTPFLVTIQNAHGYVTYVGK
jgi:hypothetical protein